MTSDQITEDLRTIARTIDQHYNGDLKGADRKVGFIVMVWPFDGGERDVSADPKARFNYISNAERDTIPTLLHQQASYMEAKAHDQETA